MPVGPRLEKAATWLLLSVIPNQTGERLVVSAPSCWTTTVTRLVMWRGSSELPDGDDILGGAGRLDGIGQTEVASVVAVAGIAGGEDEEDGLGAGDIIEGVAVAASKLAQARV